jgi:hypothetical protein
MCMISDDYYNDMHGGDDDDDFEFVRCRFNSDDSDDDDEKIKQTRIDPL